MQIKELYQNEIITLNSYLEKCGVRDIEEFISPTGKYLDNCHLYNNMLDGVQMFKYHYLQNDGVYILCDSGDTDGITSTTILYQYMKALNPDWDIEILLHSGKQRGLQDNELFQKVMNNPKGLIIIPDSGTNDRNRVADIYKNTNMNVLVLDHHSFKKNEYNLQGVIINNQDDNCSISKCGSGCLVTHKFLEALDIEFNKNWSSYFIDMVALSLVSDSMKMSDEQNRTYYHWGLETIDCVNNMFLKELIATFIGDKPYTQRDISFKIVPKINSICRSQNQELKQRVILAFLGYDNVQEVLELCKQSHKNQIELVNKIIEQNNERIKKNSDNQLIILTINDMPKSYSGLIAGRIMEICGGKPTIIGKVKNDEFIGSLRSPIPLRTELDNNDLVSWASGHEDSCGISIPNKNIVDLINYYNSIEMSYEPCIQVLKSYSIKNIPKRLFGLFGEHTRAVWGHGIKKPIFHITLDYSPTDIKVMGKSQTTLKITQNGIDIVFFFVNANKKEELGLILEESTDMGYENEVVESKFWSPIDNYKRSLEIIGTLDINRYVGKNGKVYENNQVVVEKFEVKEYKQKTAKDLF